MNKSVIQKKLQKSFIHKNSIINSAELLQIKMTAEIKVNFSWGYLFEYKLIVAILLKIEDLKSKIV